MEDYDGIIIGAVGIIIAILVFFGIVTAIKSSFQDRPKEEKSGMVVSESKMRARETQEQYRQYMDQQKQRRKDDQRMRRMR